jgi:hypothetical protein
MAEWPVKVVLRDLPPVLGVVFVAILFTWVSSRLSAPDWVKVRS